MASWEPVNRLRVRFELAVVFDELKTCSSDEEARLDEDSERGRPARIGAISVRSRWWGALKLEALLYTSETRLPRLHDARVNGMATRRAMARD